MTLIGNSLYQPEAQDPLGLTKAQWYADPRQADPAATLFDTRKTVNQQQGGATWDQALTQDTTLRVTGYGGTRTVRQYLSLSGVALTSSGGVTDLRQHLRWRRCARGDALRRGWRAAARHRGRDLRHAAPDAARTT